MTHGSYEPCTNTLNTSNGGTLHAGCTSPHWVTNDPCTILDHPRLDRRTRQGMCPRMGPPWPQPGQISTNPS